MTTAWWEDVYKFVDIWDIEWKASEDRDRFEAFVRDLIVSRPTEWAVLLDLFADAYNHQYTRAQSNALDLYAQGVRNGCSNPIQYVADRRGTTYNSARRLLNRAKQRKMVTFGLSDHSIDERIDWQPPRKVVKRRLAAVKVDCAGGGNSCEHKALWRYGLCWPCLREFGIPGERSPQTAKWLDAEIKRIRNQAYHDVVNDLIAEHRFGKWVDSLDEYDAYAEAS